MARKWYGSKWIRPEKRLAIYMRDDWRCQYCLKDLRRVKASRRTLDHIIPREHPDSSNDPLNLVTACKECNDRKSGMTLASYCAKYAVRAYDRIEQQRWKEPPLAEARAIYHGDAAPAKQAA